MTTTTTDRALTTLDRVSGALHGVALGDAMGMPGELWSKDRIVREFGRITEFLPGPDGHFIVDGFRAGQVTDDTQQMIMLAEAIEAGHGRVDATTIAEHLVAWADSVGASRGHFLGPTSARAIELLRSGVPWQELGMAGSTNGAAMRIAPIGVLCPISDLPALVRAVHETCRIAHDTRVAVQGASMIAAAIASLVDDVPNQTAEDRVAAALRSASAAAELAARFGRDEPTASIIVRTRMGVGIAQAASDDDAFLQDLYDIVGAATETIESVPAAIAIFTRAGADPMRCALLAANLGGDTDTIGAMATSLSGAAGGASAIPEHVRAQLDAVNDLSLEAHAHALLRLRTERTPQTG